MLSHAIKKTIIGADYFYGKVFNMDTKSHYKMFKAGKLWMTTLISVAVLGIANTAHADANQSKNASTDGGSVTDVEANQGAEQIQKSAVTLHANAATPSSQTTGTADQANETTQDNSGSVADQQRSTTATTNQGSRSTDSQATMQRADSTITVSNPTDYPNQAAALVGHNSQGQAYYIFQIVNLNGSKINNRQARLLVAVDPANPQGTVYVYVTDDNYSRRYQWYVIAPNAYRDISVSSTGAPIKNPTRSQIYRISNTAPRQLSFNGNTINVPASLSIKTLSGSKLSSSPVYGLGNQNSISYTDKVDITPNNQSSAIEYIYRDKDGNYDNFADFLPANVPVPGITGQNFVISNVNNYKLVLKGHYLTNQQGSLANTANGKDFAGSVSQFQIGHYYQKTLYNWDRSINEILVYELISPDGTMNISQILPNGSVQTLQVPKGSYKQFSNGTYARNPFVDTTSSVQLIYADLGHIIPVDQDGNVISNIQPIYNNDPADPHKADTTASPDLTSEGWVLQDPSQQTITPTNPGEDTRVVYVKLVVNEQQVTVKQTVQYQYSDGITEGRPSLPKDNTQSAEFTHRVVTNPITGDVLEDSWTPAQQFTAVASPEIAGFYPDQLSAGGNKNVTYLTPDVTYVVKYLPRTATVESRDVTQTVSYEYADGVTKDRPTLPQTNVQKLTFNRVVHWDAQGNIIEDNDWIPATGQGSGFKVVKTPKLTGFYANLAEAGSNEPVTQDSPDTSYVVLYAPGDQIKNKKTITQTVHYQYADGITEKRPELPKDNVQSVEFNQTIIINPWTGKEADTSAWTPENSQFNIVGTPGITGFYADKASAGSADDVTATSSDTYYVVNYAAPVSTVVENRTVYQHIKYEYADGITTGRPELPDDDTQELVFSRTETRNPWTNEVISSSWSPSQQFTVVETPGLTGFYPDQESAGSAQDVNYDSPNSEYVVKYAAPDITTETKSVHQVIRYEYADGITSGRPSLPANNEQTLTFTHTIVKNPWTNDVISDTWTPAQSFATVVTPEIQGFESDYASIEGQQVDHNSADLEYVVKYTKLSDNEKPGQNGGDQEQITQPEKPTNTPTTSMDASQSNHNQAHRLPQTGNQNADAIVGLGLLSGMLGMFGFGKRKEH